MFQLGATGKDIMLSITDFFRQAFNVFAHLWFWQVIVVGLMVLAIFVMAFLVGFSYENRILKSINRINSYFLAKPFITEENLVEFNLKMKKVPKVLRNNWQIYMLNREDTPTTYINVNSCIDKPLRTSSIEKNIGNFTIFTILLVLISFLVGLQYVTTIPQASEGLSETIFVAGIIPLVLVFLYTVFILIIKAAKNDIYSMLYDNFPLYERNLTKAVSTLPSYVDYEILFTKKEIKEGIPILQQYLEKRALVEQQELEKARANSVACEEYDFSELGIDGSLVLERAMKECETFIRTRNRLREECGSIETEKENYKKNFETTTKDYQRKLQASRENLESLKSQQENSTNRIESNYIRKQQADEIKKQQQLEKDNEEAVAKFNEEQISLQQEIDKREQEIEEKKAFVQQAMLLEFKHYANTLYKALTQKATELGNQKLVSLAQENADLKALLTDLQGVGSNAEQLDPQANLIQQTDVTTEGLYEMSNSDVSQMQENRETSEAMSQEEAAKTEEHEAKKAAQQEAELMAEVAAAAGKPVEEIQKPEVTDAPTDPIENTDTTTDDSTNTTVDGTTDAGIDVGTDDGGKQMDNAETKESPAAEEDLDAIQKQIEEENNKLQKQKQEFENDLNNTISKMDNTAAPTEAQVVEPVVEPVVEEAPQVAPQPEPQPAPVVEPAPAPEVVEPTPATVVEPAPVVEPEPVVEAPAVEPAPAATAPAAEPDENGSPARRSAARGRSARGSARSSSRGNSAAKATSEIDALNAEMQKLLDSTKK